jgi:hypothetical protein
MAFGTTSDKRQGRRREKTGDKGGLQAYSLTVADPKVEILGFRVKVILNATRWRMILTSLAVVSVLSADSGWIWQNPLPQGNDLWKTAAVTSNVVVAVGLAGTILRTSDGGATWTAQSSGTNVGLDSIFCTDVNTRVAVGDGDNILRTTNGGSTWTVTSTGYLIQALLGCFLHRR